MMEEVGLRVEKAGSWEKLLAGQRPPPQGVGSTFLEQRPGPLATPNAVHQ